MKMNVIFIFDGKKNGKNRGFPETSGFGNGNNPAKTVIQRPALSGQAPQPQGHFPLRQFRMVLARAKAITPKTRVPIIMVERFSETKAIIRLLPAAARLSGRDSGRV
jgi:hypothetical protein